jgi:hypothetical protein
MAAMLYLIGAWWQTRVGKIHSLWIAAKQQNPRHDLSFSSCEGLEEPSIYQVRQI